MENGAIYIGEWYYICINKKGLLIKNTEKVSKSGKMGLFMKGSGKTIKLMLKADLCTQTETYMKAIGSTISLKALKENGSRISHMEGELSVGETGLNTKGGTRME